MHDQIDITPVNPQIQRRGGDHGAQFVATHGGFHPPPLRRVQRPVMQRDRQAVVIDPP